MLGRFDGFQKFDTSTPKVSLYRPLVGTHFDSSFLPSNGAPEGFFPELFSGVISAEGPFVGHLLAGGDNFTSPGGLTPLGFSPVFGCAPSVPPFGVPTPACC